MRTASTLEPPASDRISWPTYLGLGLAAAVLGVVTSIGVWLFNQAFNAINNLTFNTIGGALQPIGAWTIALIPALGGILVALIMKFGAKPDKLAAMAHIIDGVTEHGGRLNIRNGVTFIIASAVGIWLPEIFGTGLSQMKQIFSGTVFPFTTLIALAIAKLILTPASLGSGFAGGVIGPALCIGAALGYAYGDIIAQLFPTLGISPIAFAMVATAAMLAGTFHAPLFGAMMILEMTNNYGLLVPVLFGVALAYALARKFQPGSAYTFELPGAGIHLKRGTFTTERFQK